jgi:hypothetical protein
MNDKAVRTAVRSRYGSHDERTALETSTLLPWQPRDATDGSRAILVNERQTVFDRPSPALQQRPDPLDAIADPVWQSHEGRFWTPDLVHCRLVIVGEIIARLPGRLRLQGYVSQLGNIALSEAEPAHRVPPTPYEITLADWTWQELMALDEGPRSLLQARAFSLSFDKIAQHHRRRGRETSKTAVIRDYLEQRRRLAARWQLAGVKVGALDLARWRELFDRAK